MRWLSFTLPARIGPRLSLSAHFFDDPVSQSFPVHLSPVIHEHKFVKLKVLKDVSIKSSAHTSDPITSTDISQKFSLLVSRLLFRILNHQRYSHVVFKVFDLHLSVERAL